MNKGRSYWNKKIGKRAKISYASSSPQSKQWNNRSGIIQGCHRGDYEKDDPYVSIWIDTKPDGSSTGGFLWQLPSHCLEL